jgi:hypothetical protein
MLGWNEAIRGSGIHEELAFPLPPRIGWIADGDSFVSGITYEEFSKDTTRLFAAIRALEVISEASRRLPEEMKLRHKQIDWPAVAAAGKHLPA